MRRGHIYGSTIVDLERSVVVDVLPDRTAETFARWRTEHSGVEIISRDRRGSNAEGAASGAPEAVQVADCWHRFANLVDAHMELFDQHRLAIGQHLRGATDGEDPCQHGPDVSILSVPDVPTCPLDPDTAAVVSAACAWTGSATYSAGRAGLDPQAGHTAICSEPKILYLGSAFCIGCCCRRLLISTPLNAATPTSTTLELSNLVRTFNRKESLMGFYGPEPFSRATATYLWMGIGGPGAFIVEVEGEAPNYTSGIQLVRDAHWVGGLKLDVMGWTGPLGEGTSPYKVHGTFPGEFRPKIIVSGSGGEQVIEVEEVPHNQLEVHLKKQAVD